MKHYFILLIILFTSILTSAQKHNLYTDAGISLYEISPGFSATYNYNVIRSIGLGIGVQGYRFSPTLVDSRDYRRPFIPAVFADMRFTVCSKEKNQFFSFLDCGMDFYKHDNKATITANSLYSTPNDNGVYIGLGLGYFHRMIKRGGGLYASFKIISNWYSGHAVDLLTNEEYGDSAGAGNYVLSIGFKL